MWYVEDTIPLSLATIKEDIILHSVSPVETFEVVNITWWRRCIMVMLWLLWQLLRLLLFFNWFAWYLVECKFDESIKHNKIKNKCCIYIDDSYYNQSHLWVSRMIFDKTRCWKLAINFLEKVDRVWDYFVARTNVVGHIYNNNKKL